ncbi:MAG: succinate dehydrogenase assembly factor 2 [Gammaproteobacteria bacterium]
MTAPGCEREYARLRWRCRRGLKELDDLLLGYFEQDYPTAGAEEQAAFRVLLDLPESLLCAYLLRGDARVANPILGNVIRKIAAPKP